MIACPPGRHDLYTVSHEFQGGHSIPPHHHAEHQLVYASCGVMTVHTAEGSWVVPPHRGVWVPARTPHWIEISGAVSMRTLYLRPRLSRVLPEGCQVLNVPPLLRELILHAVEQGSLSRRSPRQARLLAVILDQLAEVRAAPLHLRQPRDPRARHAAELLRERPGDRRPLAALLRGTGASPRTLERLFPAETGLTLGRWRQHLRLVHSLRLLAAGAKVSAVAHEVGYDSPSAFVSCFRKVFGTTPARYFRD